MGAINLLLFEYYLLKEVIIHRQQHFSQNDAKYVKERTLCLSALCCDLSKLLYTSSVISFGRKSGIMHFL